MKTAFILAFILLLLSFHSNAQQTIDKLNVNQLKLPKESANKALILDGAGQVKSSSTITDTELGYLEGLSDTLVNLLSGKANDSDVVKLSGNQSVDGVKTFTGKLVASSTVNGSIPCPVMTEAQRDLFTPVEGDCVYNSDTLKLNVFDGSVWKDVGGAGGISLWLTANPYNVNDIVIESDKIYRCLIAHTSGTFATDLGAGKWGEVSQGLTSPVALADGGTGIAITPVAGSIVYVDADSFEQLSPGSAGQILQSNGSSAPSWVNKSISAKSENGSSVTAEELQVSNNQLTQVDTNKHLIESGNNNLLINPSFEHSTFSTGWTNSVGTFTEETVVEIHGKKAAKLVLSSQTMALTQDSSLYAAQFADGVQGLASVRVKSDAALKVCSVQAGTVSTTNCVDVQANNKWGLYKVPFILGATSNGISIASTGAVTGTVYIDDAFVGAASLTQNMNACNSISCETLFNATISTAGVVSKTNYSGWVTSSAGVSGSYTLTFPSGQFSNAPSCQCNNDDGNTRGCAITSVTATSAIVTTYQNGSTAANAPFNIICERVGADFTAAKQFSNGNTYSSTNADTDWAACGHTAASFTGFGTVSAIETQCKRDGGDLLMKGKFTLGVATNVEARLSLPTWNGVQLTSKGTPVIPSLQMTGHVSRSVNTSENGVTLIEPSVSYITFGLGWTSGSELTKALGTTIGANGYIISITARIPIEGWQNSNIIIGQFNGLESCSSTLDCTDTFSAKVSAAGVVSDENVDWINGNCSWLSGSATCTFKTNIFTVAPNCNFTTSNAQGQRINITSISSTQFVIVNRSNDGTANVASDFNVICQKQGVDYVGKTAKAVASDQNLRSPGITKGAVCSFGFGGASYRTSCTTSPCIVYNANGCSPTVTRSSASNYLVTFPANTWSGANYNCTYGVATYNTGTMPPGIYETADKTATTLSIQAIGSASTDAALTINCHGITP